MDNSSVVIEAITFR